MIDPHPTPPDGPTQEAFNQLSEAWRDFWRAVWAAWVSSLLAVARLAHRALVRYPSNRRQSK